MDSIKTKMKKELESLSYTTSKYRELKKNLSDINSSINVLNGEVAKLIDISKEVKSSDFKFSKTLKEINVSDAEKLRLMRENESLKKLVAGVRRKGYSRRDGQGSRRRLGSF